GKGGGGGGHVSVRRIAGLSNEELVRRAFAAPDTMEEFKAEKGVLVDKEVSGGREKAPGQMAGWGSWAGEGAPKPRKAVLKREREREKAQAAEELKRKKARKDDSLPKVIINEKRQKRSAKYSIAAVPYPFTSREQYERSVRQPIGSEWNTSKAVGDLTQPAVITKPGQAIAPMKLDKLQRDQARERAAGRKG
ncbi:unnamed protein product, partial [Discosporangium mesarthrocarpum]